MDESAAGKLIWAKRIAVVGLSASPDRDSNMIANYLLSVGKEVVPVNPHLNEVLGLKCYRSMGDVPGKVDLAVIFRRAEACAEMAREAVAAGAKGVWLPLGVSSAEARRIAAEGGLWFVEDRCIMIEHRQAVEDNWGAESV